MVQNHRMKARQAGQWCKVTYLFSPCGKEMATVQSKVGIFILQNLGLMNVSFRVNQRNHSVFLICIFVNQNVHLTFQALLSWKRYNIVLYTLEFTNKGKYFEGLDPLSKELFHVYPYHIFYIYCKYIYYYLNYHNLDSEYCLPV